MTPVFRSLVLALVLALATAVPFVPRSSSGNSDASIVFGDRRQGDGGGTSSQFGETSATSVQKSTGGGQKTNQGEALAVSVQKQTGLGGATQSTSNQGVVQALQGAGGGGGSSSTSQQSSNNQVNIQSNQLQQNVEGTFVNVQGGNHDVVIVNTSEQTRRLLALRQAEPFLCPDDLPGFFPHELSCDKYYACDKGVPTLKTCGNGLAFVDTDPTYENENCDYLHNVQCGDRTELEPPISSQNCPRQYGIFADEVKCDTYWSCWAGESNQYKCPPGKAYHPEKRACVWADEVHTCKKNARSTTVMWTSAL